MVAIIAVFSDKVKNIFSCSPRRSQQAASFRFFFGELRVGRCFWEN